MHELIVEKRPLGANPVVKDLAQQLYAHMSCRKVVILTDNPRGLISPLRRHWLKLARKVWLERARAVDMNRVNNLVAITDRMLSLKFTLRYPPVDYPGDIHIATVAQAMQWAPECQALYVACEVSKEQLYMITAWMPRQGTVVIYG